MIAGIDLLISNGDRVDGTLMETEDVNAQKIAEEIPKKTLDYFNGDEIRARVFYEKYVLKDQNDKELEYFPEDMWKRLAREIAGVESTEEKRREWNEKFLWLMQDFRFIPGGRIMFGAGRNLRVTLLNCLVAGSKIYTENGQRNIEDIQVGERVLTHKGRLMPVAAVAEQEKHTLLVKIKMWYDEQEIVCTPEHKFLTFDRGWVEAKDLRVSDYVRIAVENQEIPIASSLRLSDYISLAGLREQNGFVYTETPFQIKNGYGAISLMSKRSVLVRNEIKISTDFGRFAGLFLSEGAISYQTTVYFTFNLKETALAKEVLDLGKKLFDVEGKIRTVRYKKGGWLRVEFYSKIMCEALLKMFNHYCYDKKIPDVLLKAGKDVKMALIGGLFTGDGCIHDNGVFLQLSNEELSHQTHKLLLSLGIINGITLTPNGRFAKRAAYRININGRPYSEKIEKWMQEDYCESRFVECPGSKFKLDSVGPAFKIRSLEMLPEDTVKVYDVAVAEDHSFVVGDVVAHNCYVIPIKDDSIEAIFDWCKEAARTFSFGGGAGTDISVLRPKGANVNNSAVHSTGSFSFMEVMSETTHTIGQSGRRGALMITISVEHPDVFDFIRIKRDLKSVRYANISVRVTDDFMHAVEDDKEFTLHFENKIVGRMERKIRARELWTELIKSARDWAEPGIMFWDTIKRYSPSEYNGMEVITTHPCSEQPLEPYGACDLGNINLSAFVTMPFTDKASLDWKMLEKTVRYAVRFLDNVLDYNATRHPLKAQAEAGANSRRIGLGVTGMADMLVKLRIKYDTDKALAFIDELFSKIKNITYDESCELAKEKGTFKAFDKDKHLSMLFVRGLSTSIREKIAQSGLRNVALLTVPPVGSGSVLAGTSSGIEPIFAFSYTRRSESLSKELFKVYHPLVQEYMNLAGLNEESELPDFFIPAHKILPEFRVKMQGVIQRHIDSAISSTVNLPSDTTTEQVEQIYMQAWKAGCKSISVYREGSREGVLITAEEEKRNKKPATYEEEWERPQMMTGRTVKFRVTQGTLYLTADFEGDRIREVFINLGKAGSEEKSYAEALGRLISKYLQLGGDIKEVIDSLKGIRSTSVMWEHGLRIYSVPDAIAKALEIAIGESGQTKPLIQEEAASNIDGIQQHISAKGASEVPRPGICPECGETTLINENGCFVCKNCGYTKCE